MIKSKENKIYINNNFQISYGVINVKEPDTLYITCKTWITPSKNISNDNINDIKCNLQKVLKKTLLDNIGFKPKFIMDFNLCHETLKIGKKNKLKFEIFLEQDDNLVEFKQLGNKVINLCNNILDNFQENLQFYCLSLTNKR